MIQAMGGLMSVTGQADGSPGAEPMKVGVAVADLFAGMYAANAILAALLHARATGRGQAIDIALFEVQAAMLANQASNWFVSGKVPTRLGNAHPNLAPYQPFPTLDGAVVIAVGNDGQFRALCVALGDPALAEDDGFRTNAQRVARRAELTGRLSARTARRTTSDWIAALEAAGVPSGPINTIDRVFAEPQAAARDLVISQARDDLPEPVLTVASPMRFSQTPPAYPRPPPALGADTDEVLKAQLGLSADALAALRSKGVL
jgi:crotonobetainyl-CoA:carnitine CoA-transferase CaiB-like acyl-CoA transferase